VIMIFNCAHPKAAWPRVLAYSPEEHASLPVSLLTYLCFCLSIMAPPFLLHFAVLQKRGELERAAADAVLKALASPAAAGGDVLCFMPGVAEIRRLQQLLQQDSAIRKAGIVVQQLHGGLSPQQQDEVIR
jgi:HrpA-like RNA helicase